MSEERKKLVGFALAESRSGRRDAQEEFFEFGKGSMVWRRGEGEGGNEAKSVDDFDAVLCVHKARC